MGRGLDLDVAPGAEIGESLVDYADLESCAGDGDIAGESLTEALAGPINGLVKLEAQKLWAHGHRSFK